MSAMLKDSVIRRLEHLGYMPAEIDLALAPSVQKKRSRLCLKDKAKKVVVEYRGISYTRNEGLRTGIPSARPTTLGAAWNNRRASRP